MSESDFKLDQILLSIPYRGFTQLSHEAENKPNLTFKL